MKKIVFALPILLFPFTMQAQFSNLLNKAKNKIQQRADTKVDQAMNKGLDEAENSVKSDKNKKDKSAGIEDNGNATSSDTDDTSSTGETIVSYSKIDFVPGDKILYSEDFTQDNIGELPLTWNSSGKGEVMTISGKEGKWARGYQNNILLSGNTQKFGDNYTIEFDMIYYFNPKTHGYLLPDMTFGIFSSGDKDGADNTMLRGHQENNELKFNIHSGNNAIQAFSYSKRSENFRSDGVKVPDWDKNFNKVLHYSIQVQKTRARLWVNESKLFDIPRAVNTGDAMNNIYFEMEGSNYKDDEIGYYVSNIKIATGLPDTRHKLIEEGKFSTTGILFNIQSAVIKPESYGVIKEIATVLKENPTVSIRIVGHTSNDGDLNANMKLSDQRAAAVKKMLIKEFSIEEARLKTEGKGPKEPVADNKTPEGRAQNRRVEFIKL